MISSHPRHAARTTRGFALLVTIILTSVILSLALSLLDIAYKQVLLSTTAKQSGIAFYNADSIMECALYYDQKLDAFNYASAPSSQSITCNTLTGTVSSPPASGGIRTSTVTIPCAGNSGTLATITVYKDSSAGTRIYADAYNTCNVNDPRRLERGLKATY